MSEDIPFDRTFDFKPGVPKEVAPGVRAIVAGNPSPFTFHGTMSYVVGQGPYAIVDPGPDDERHIDALLEAAGGGNVSHILVTHTHRDHSPGVAPLKAKTGARVYAEGPHRLSRALHSGEAFPMDAAADTDFRPDVALKEGEVVEGKGFTFEAIPTPGHTKNHMAYALHEGSILFSGDHVMGWSTPVVAPPDGSMTDYMASLKKLAGRTEDIYLAGHGAPIRNAQRFVRSYIRHREAREASILHRLNKGETDIPTIVRAIYIGIDPRLVKAAGLSVLAHMEDLVERGVVVTQGVPSVEGTYRLT